MRFLFDLFSSILSFFVSFRRPQERRSPRKTWGNRAVHPPPVFSPVSVLQMSAPVQQRNSGADNSADPTLGQATAPVTSSETALEADDLPEKSEQPVSNLSGKASKGVSWTLAGTLFTQVLNLARTAALARLLSQGDFGVAAMAGTVIAGLYTLTNTGVSASVISAQFNTEKELHEYTNSVWTMELARGMVTSLLLAIMAWPVARFYGEDRLIPILLVLTLTPILGALANIGLTLQARRMEFNRSTLHVMLSGLLSVAFTIGLAWWTRNYWALVWGQVIGAVVGMGSSYIFSSYRPRLNFNLDNMRRAFDFGKHIFVIGLANYVLTMMDNVSVGRILGATALGTYAIAYSFCSLPRNFINNAFNSILFPMFASANREENSNRINIILERAVTLACTVLLATLTPLIAFAPAVVRIIYGEKWVDAIGPMRILLLAGFFVSIIVLLSAFFVGINRPQLESKSKIFDAAIFLVVIYPFTLWLGIVGAALGSCLTSLISLGYRRQIVIPVAPQACQRMPWLIGSAVLCSVIISEAAIVLMTLVSSGFNFAALDLISALLSPPLPSLGVAWLQLVLGLPLLGLTAIASFTLVQPSARGEVQIILTKARARFGRNRA